MNHVEKSVVFLVMTLVGFGAFAAEWTVQKSLEISEKQYVIDGKDKKDFKCPAKKQQVALLKIGTERMLIECDNNYGGGVTIGEEKIAETDGDAGDTWEIQTVIFTDEKNKAIFFEKKTKTTQDPSFECEMNPVKLKKEGWSEKKLKDCLDGKLKSDCQIRSETKKWNPTSKKFESAQTQKSPNRLLDSKTMRCD